MLESMQMVIRSWRVPARCGIQLVWGGGMLPLEMWVVADRSQLRREIVKTG